MNESPALTTSSRLASVDALRGVAVAAMILVNSPGDWGQVWWPLDHSAWHGCTPTDLVFPLFLFLVGVSLALGSGGRRDRARGPLPLKPGLIRAARLVGLGVALHAVAWLSLGTPAFRPMGVLQRIGLCSALATVLLLGLTMAAPLRGRRGVLPAVLLVLLAAWAALLSLGGTLAPMINVAARVDTAVLGRHAWQYDAATGLAQDPEGLLSTLGALATCWLGVIAGERLRRRSTRTGETGRALLLMAGGLLAAGWLASLWMPWNKALWTPSFVLWSGGWATALLALAHLAIDQNGAPAWGRRFGINAITAYAGSWLLTCALEASGAG
ncbi:heparan-alpha-glucosaminide N-acetyltransferase domain-containing protein, partial [Ideonella sp.]|uniref:heparan-alpha-glucosaminide N-acetyltransferase domain-containing protein n=1 Tax=Ideonella sp. TaxID=1929293 RepID=UPI003BB6B5E7